MCMCSVDDALNMHYPIVPIYCGCQIRSIEELDTSNVRAPSSRRLASAADSLQRIIMDPRVPSY